jgi:hypothetical protein
MTKNVVRALLLLAIVMLVAHLEYRFASTEEAIRNELPPQLRSCDATMRDGTIEQMSAERCYFLKGSR